MKLTEDYLKKIILETLNESDQDRFKYNIEEMEHSLSLIQSSVSQISENINKLKTLESINSKEGLELLKKIDYTARKMAGTYNRKQLGPIENPFADIRGWVQQIRHSFTSDTHRVEAEKNASRNEPDVEF